MVRVVCRSDPGPTWACDVDVEHGGESTRHRITVLQADAQRLAVSNDRAGVEDLVRRSFDFLLEREPARSILASFDLSLIARYFPEYERAFRR